MPPPDVRQRIYLLLLVVALIVTFWLADALDRSAVSENIGVTFSPPGGAYDHNLLLELQPSHPRAPVIFTTNGTVPTTTIGTLYERPLRLDSDAPGVTVLRAREIVDGVPGPMQSASYIVGVRHTLPILSIIADPADLWDQERGILVNTWQRGPEWERPVHATYIEGDHGQGFEIPAGLRIHPNEQSPSSGSKPFEQPKLSFRLYFRQDYGAVRLEYPLFPDHQQDTPSYKRLTLQAGDKSGRWTLLDDQLLSDVATEVDGHAAQGRFVLLFLNGESWGIYRLSERIDRFFLQDHFGISSTDLIQDGDATEGDGQQWGALMHWLATHDLYDPANYAHLQSQIDLDGLTDYAIIQIYFSQNNLSAARPRSGDGRWFWLYGDDSQGDARQGEALTLLKPSDDPSDLTVLFGKLLENPDYRARFVRRAADLLNTSLAPAAVDAHIDRLAAQLRPDMGYETARWPGVLWDSGFGESEWERNVAALRGFAQHRPEALRRQVAAEFDLRGTTTVTFNESLKGSGYLVVNEWPITTLPWSGTYFLGTDLHVIAVPASGYVFAGWENGLEEASTSRITFTVDGPRTIMLRFVALGDDDPGLRPNDVIINEYWINDNGTRYNSVGGYPIEGDWFELLVTRPRTIDLRGWRITDNDTKTATSEGSIILPPLEAFAVVPPGTVILIIATESDANAARFRVDDLDPSDGQMVLYVGNGHLDVTTDPGLNIGTGDDNLVLLAPGPSPSNADDIGVDFVAEGGAVTPLSFGVLADGVVFDAPFQGLGGDDGALFTGAGNNDNGDIGWIVDPQPRQSGDDTRPGATNILTPGALNYRQNEVSLPAGAVWLLLIGLIGVVVLWRLRIRAVTN